MKILVTGENGQLGSELKKISYLDNNFEWIFTNRHLFDISILDSINIYLNKCKPNVIINCAAYTAVDKAENDFELADTVNHKAVSLIAEWCNYNNCNLLHISTDYVFDGNSSLPYFETDQTNPLNNYGKTKLLGDIACLRNKPSSIVIRTGWLYSGFGDNFLLKMINLMQSKDEIKVINDQFGSPTHAEDLANVILHIIRYKKWLPGVYNYTNRGNISWYDFANEIKAIYGFRTTIKPISSKNYSQKAKRPKYSILDNSKIINLYNVTQMNYLDSLKNCIKIVKIK